MPESPRNRASVYEGSPSKDVLLMPQGGPLHREPEPPLWPSPPPLPRPCSVAIKRQLHYLLTNFLRARLGRPPGNGSAGFQPFHNLPPLPTRYPPPTRPPLSLHVDEASASPPVNGPSFRTEACERSTLVVKRCREGGEDVGKW